MSKAAEPKKETKKKAQKTLKEKRAAKAAKKSQQILKYFCHITLQQRSHALLFIVSIAVCVLPNIL